MSYRNLTCVMGGIWFAVANVFAVPINEDGDQGSATKSGSVNGARFGTVALAAPASVLTRDIALLNAFQIADADVSDDSLPSIATPIMVASASPSLPNIDLSKNQAVVEAMRPEFRASIEDAPHSDSSVRGILLVVVALALAGVAAFGFGCAAYQLKRHKYRRGLS